jgi:hypothetical protein
MSSSSSENTFLLDPSQFDYVEEEWESYLEEELAKGNPWKTKPNQQAEQENHVKDWEKHFFVNECTSTLLGKRQRF